MKLLFFSTIVQSFAISVETEKRTKNYYLNQNKEFPETNRSICFFVVVVLLDLRTRDCD